LGQLSFGIIEPIIVRKLTNKKYEIIKGIRRFLGARRFGSKEIDCSILHIDERDVWRVVLVENTARENLPPMDLAGYIDHVIKRYGISQNEIARTIGKNKSTVSNLLRVYHNSMLRDEVRYGYHSLQNAIELETIAPRRGEAREEELARFQSFVGKTRGFSKKQIRNAIIADYFGKRPQLKCNRCKTSFEQEELSSFKICFKCQEKAGLERVRKMRNITALD
jgi:transcriptional regulator with XRE-family HTH domain